MAQFQRLHLATYTPFTITPNFLDQDFTAERRGEKWGADISYVWTREGWPYLAVVIDLFARRIVGWPSSTVSTSS